MASPKLTLSEKRRLVLSYYAGFSEDFVSHCLRTLVPTARSVVDPWNGSGTTTFVCAKNGIEAYGNDLSPVANVIATARSCAAAALSNRSCLSKSENEDALGCSKYVKLTEGLYFLGQKWLDQSEQKFHLQRDNALIITALFRIIRRYTTRIKLNNPTWIPGKSLDRVVLRHDFLANLFVQELRIVYAAVGRNSISRPPYHRRRGAGNCSQLWPHIQRDNSVASLSHAA